MSAPVSFSGEGTRIAAQRRPRRLALLACAALLALAACAQPAAQRSDATAVTVAPTTAPRQPIAGGPTLLRDDITLRRVGAAGPGTLRLAVDPTDSALYTLHPGNGLSRVDPATGALTPVADTAAMVGSASPSGMAFGPDGVLYVVGNRSSGARNKGVVFRGRPGAGAWTLVAETAQYALSGTQFDHLFNGIAVSPDGKWIYVNSGSRTDHGEVQSNSGNFPGAREGALTSRLFRIPADAEGLRLEDDEQANAAYVYARGLRNAYDLAFAPNGDLFAVDNGPDADLPDELNWIRSGMHYGFPWRFGSIDNPVRAADYDPAADGRLSSDFVAVQQELYQPEPDFPPPPGRFTDPVANNGPAGAVTRDADGAERSVSDGSLHTFTPHRSPLGLVFVADAGFPADLQADDTTLSALVLSWGAAGGNLSDQGQDLLHLTLARTDMGDAYTTTATQIARDFRRPIDAALIGNKLYVLEFDGESAIWELAFQQ